MIDPRVYGTLTPLAGDGLAAEPFDAQVGVDAEETFVDLSMDLSRDVRWVLRLAPEPAAYLAGRLAAASGVSVVERGYDRPELLSALSELMETGNALATALDLVYRQHEALPRWTDALHRAAQVVAESRRSQRS
jgi:hypothetical protein